MPGSFIDNPVIAGLGEQLGLGDVFNQMRQNAMIADKTPKSAPNVPEYKNRPYLPRMESPAGGVKPGQGGGGNPITPGTMDQSTLQSPQVSQLLGMYGVQAPTTPPDPNLFVHNPTAHPVLGGLLEHGLEGLAYAHPGQNFFQSLIGGVQGMQQANAARSAQVNAQLEAPLQQAAQIQQLQHGVDEHNTATDNMQYHQALIQDAQAKQRQAAQDFQQKLLSTAPRGNPDGTQEVMKLDPVTGMPVYTRDTTNADYEKMMQAQYFQNEHDRLVQKYGGAQNVPPSEIAASRAAWERQLSLGKGANQVVIQNMRDSTSERNHDTPTGNSAARGGGANKPGYVSPLDKARLSDLDKQITVANRRYEAAAKISGQPVTTEDGQILIPGSQKHKEYLTKYQTAVSQLQAQKAAILGQGPAPAASSLPTTFSKGNPFATPQQK